MKCPEQLDGWCDCGKCKAMRFDKDKNIHTGFVCDMLKEFSFEEIENGLRICKKAGLYPHITAMIGYPWETYSDAKNTVVLARDLFKKGYVDTL